MRVWRHGSEELREQRGELRVLRSLLALTRRDWKEPPADYQLVDGGGSVCQRFIAVTWEDEDDVGATLFAVESGALVQLDVRSGPRGESCGEKVVLTGLDVAPARPDEPRAPPPPHLARVDELAAAARGRDHGPAFAQAEVRLRERFVAWGEPRAEGLLRALVSLGALYDRAPLPPLRLALGELVRACRFAAFDLDVPRDEPDPAAVIAPPPSLPDGAVLDAAALAEARALAGRLRELARLTEVDADVQSDIDATSTAAQLYRTEQAISRAREALERAL